MVRSISVYLVAAAIVLLAVGLFLPAGRGLNVLSLQNGETVGSYAIEAEEMGCLVLPPAIPITGSPSDQAFQADAESFFSSQGPLCGKSPITMLASGKYILVNLLLVVPLPLAIMAMVQLLRAPYSRNTGKRFMLITGALSVIILLIWWFLWVRFRTVPAVGFWVSLIGANLLLIAGIIAERVDSLKEALHPHPA